MVFTKTSKIEIINIHYIDKVRYMLTLKQQFLDIWHAGYLMQFKLQGQKFKDHWPVGMEYVLTKT